MDDPTKKLFTHIRRDCVRALIFVAIISAFANLLMLTVPIYMLQIFDRVLSSYSYETLLYLTIIGLFALLAYGLIEVVRSRTLITVSHWLDDNLSPEVIKKAPDELLQGNRYSLNAIGDLNRIRNTLSSPIIYSLFDLPWLPIFIIAIFLLHPSLGWLATIGAIVLFVLALINEMVTSRDVRIAGEKNQSSQINLNYTLHNSESIQAMGMLPSILSKWHGDNQEGAVLTKKSSQYTATILGFYKFIRLAIQLLILGIGAYYVIHEQITPGAMIAASILLSRAYAPIEQSIVAWKQFINCRESYGNLKKYFLKPNPRFLNIELPKPHGLIRGENIFYMPTGSTRPCLKNINFEANPREILAIIGPSTAGKSTLARIIAGVVQPSKGIVRLDGADVYSWDRSDFGNHVGYLSQNNELFQGSIRENISRMKDFPANMVIDAAQKIGIHELILQQPDSYETQFVNANTYLSGGMRQRIALARAIFGNPKVLILDEPNSNLDQTGLYALIETLKLYKKNNNTIILISHHPALIDIADKILMVQHGEVHMYGMKQDILNKIKSINKAKNYNLSTTKFG